MANTLFDSGRQDFLEGNIAVLTDTLRWFGCDHADDNPDVAVDNTLDDIATAARVPAGTDGTQTAHTALASKTSTDGTLDAADSTVSALTGDQFESLILYKGTLTDTTSPLIAKIDTATGLPFTPNGGDLVIVWDAAGIFTL